MNKLVFIALGIASASAAYEYNWIAFEEDPNTYLSFEFGVLADAYYTTTQASDNNGQAYGLLVDSYVQFTFAFELFEWYTHIVDFKFTPVSIQPYN